MFSREYLPASTVSKKINRNICLHVKLKFKGSERPENEPFSKLKSHLALIKPCFQHPTVLPLKYFMLKSTNSNKMCPSFFPLLIFLSQIVSVCGCSPSSMFHVVDFPVLFLTLCSAGSNSSFASGLKSCSNFSFSLSLFILFHLSFSLQSE